MLHHACASGNLEVLKWLIESVKDLCTDMLKQKCKVGEGIKTLICALTVYIHTYMKSLSIVTPSPSNLGKF